MNENLNQNVASAKLAATPPQCDGGPFTPMEWLRHGSRMEDEEKYGVLKQTLRCLDHFYTLTKDRTPGDVSGITDNTEGPLVYKDSGWGVRAMGSFINNSYLWASTDGVQGPSLASVLRNPLYTVGLNTWNWQHARNYEFDALTSSTRVAREEKMALVLYSLGHVLHLNQDLSQPDHVRNDNHNYSEHRIIENFGRSNYLANPSWFLPKPRGWAYWKDQQGFSKLLDFWDRGTYKSTAQPLDDDRDVELKGLTGKKLGLAEFSSGNFLGEDALYDEVVPAKDKFHHFPFPSLRSSTTYSQLRQNPAPFIKASKTKSGRSINRAIIEKARDGIAVKNHSALTFLAAKYPQIPKPRDLTLDDPNVLQEYHSILIPKAVEYSAGILDYFFRGKLELVSVAWDAQLTPAQYTITVRNKSGAPLNGGTISVWKDDATDNRSSVGFVNLTTPMADNATKQLNFSGPHVSTPTRFTVLYKGTVGQPNSDPVDEGIAIAAKRFNLAPIDWSQLVWQDMYTSSQGTFNFNGNAFSMVANSPLGALPFSEHGLYKGQVAYTGAGGPSRITLNGSLSRQGVGYARISMEIRYAGEAPFLQTSFSAPSGFYNHIIDFIVPDTADLTKTVEVYIGWIASKLEGEGGEAGSLNVSGTLSNP